MVINDEDQVVEDDEIIENNEEEMEVTETDPELSEEQTDEDPEAIQEDDDEDDRVVTIGDPEPETRDEGEEHKEAPGWVKNVRKSNRRLESEVKRLKRQLEEVNKPAVQKVELGEKPTLASCDYDDSKYEQELMSYYDRKRKVDEQAKEQTERIKAQNERVQTKNMRYVDLKKEHGFKDFGDAEATVETTLNLAQQQIIVQGAEDSALVVYALGKNPKALEDLSKTTDPVEFAFKVAKLESKLKVTNRKAPKPEKRVKTGGKTGGLSGNTDKTLERLRKEASVTRDYTKVTAYKRKLREQG